MDSGMVFPKLINRIGAVGPILAVIGVAFLAVGASAGVSQFYHAWINGWVFWMSLSTGCFGLMLLSLMVRAQWCRPVFRIFEAGAWNFPLLAFLFIPIIAAAATHHLFPWAHPAMVASDPILRYRAHWFNTPFITVRVFTIFLTFMVFLSWLTRLGKVQDTHPETRRRLQVATSRASLAAPGFLVMVLAITIGITDWVMSLDPHWYSTIYGFLFLIGSGLAAMTFAVILVTQMAIDKVQPYEELVTKQTTRDWGNLLLMMTMVWAYFSISQYLITWSGNLPEEVSFYIARNAGTFAWVTSIIVICQFFLPFLLLLSSRLKRRPNMLRNAAILIFTTRIVEVSWNVIPMFHNWRGADSGLMVQFQGLVSYIGAFLLIGGVWLALFVRNFKRGTLVPELDPQLLEVLEHAH